MRPAGRERGGAGVRLHLAAHLPWLGGYPVGVDGGAIRFRTLGGAEVVVDRAALARATRAVKQAVRDHADALAAEVGDVAAWQAAIEAALDAQKPALHAGAPLGGLWHPPVHAAALCRRALALASSASPLAPLVHAVGWMGVATRDEVAADLAWIEGRRDALLAVTRHAGADALALVLGLRELARRDGDRLVDPLIEALADDDVDAVGLAGEAHLEAIGARIAAGGGGRGGALPARGAPAGPTLRALVPWLLTAALEPRRLALRALAAIELPALALAWRATWGVLEPVAARLARPREPSWSELVGLRDAHHSVRPTPPHVHANRLGRRLRELAPALVEVVERVPAGGPPGFAAQILLGLHDARGFETRSAAWIAALVIACIEDDPVRRWPLLTTQLIATGDLRQFSEGTSVAHARRLGAVLGPLLDGVDRAAIPRLEAILLRHPSRADAIACWRVLADAPELSRTAIELALALAPTVEDLGPVTRVLAGVLDDDLVAQAHALVVVAGPHGAPIVRALLEAGDQAALRAAAHRIAAARRLRAPIAPMPAPVAPALPAALARYPAPLHDALARLATAGGARLVAGILDEAYPDPADTARELAAIEQRLAAIAPADRAAPATVRLGRRADNLRARLAAPVEVSAVRLARLRAKLVRAADRAALERWVDAVTGAIEPRILAMLHLDAVAAASWLADPRTLEVLAALADSRPITRRLAALVLARRAGPPPWDLRDAPANRAWLERVRRRGIDVGPWLDGIGAHRDGELTLALEPDPLEVMRMGEYFSTCLSLREVNFWSAVINAADANKRVIYGRDDGGAVVARCLLALTDAGDLVAFHPFCYHRELGFAAMVARFAGELARRMGASLVPRGRITPLLAGHWYDDGPVDLTGAFQFLADGSAFRRGLATLEPDALIDELTARFAPLPLEGLALSLVIELPELEARPALIVPLVPRIEACTDLAFGPRLRAARIALEAGRGDLIGAGFVEQLPLRGSDWYVRHELVELLAPRVPSRLLAGLRAVRRPITVYSRPYWDYACGLALEALHRPQQAIAHHRAAAASEDALMAERARTRLAQLGAPLPPVRQARR